MTPAALVETLRARGVTIEPRGDKLRVVPASSISPEEVEALRQHKAAVLALLAGKSPVAVDQDPASGPFRLPPRPAVRWWSYPWPDNLPRLGRRTVGPFDMCAKCSAWSWARYGSTVLCLDCARCRLRDARP